MQSLGYRSMCTWDDLRSYSIFLLFGKRKASSQVWGRHIAMLCVTLTPLVADLCNLSVFRPFGLSLQSLFQHTAEPAPCRGNFWPCVNPQFLLFLWHLACHRLGDSRAGMAFPVFPRPVLLRLSSCPVAFSFLTRCCSIMSIQ